MSEIDARTSAVFIDEISWSIVVYLVIAVFIVYFAWRSTFVRYEHLFRQRTVLIFNPQSGDFQQHSVGVSMNDLTTHFQAPPPPSLESLLDEVNGIATGTTYHIQRQDETLDTELMEEETQEIIREMDHEPQEGNEPDGLRRRRNNSANNDDLDRPGVFRSIRPGMWMHSFDTDPYYFPLRYRSPTTETPTTSDHVDGTGETNSGEITAEPTTTASSSQEPPVELGDELTIKLKYLNDDLKIVKARSNEPIGDFKK